MRPKYYVRRFLEIILRAKIHRGKLPRGNDVYADIVDAFPDFKFSVIFDVGANVGQSAKQFIETFGDVQIFCFEPSNTNFEELQHAFSMKKNVSCFNLAMGSAEGTADLDVSGISTMHRLRNSVENSDDHAEIQSARLTTLDQFCDENDIQNIDYLKIDTEGHELEVILGANEFLSQGRAAFVELELGLNPENSYHVSLEDAKARLERLNYRLFGFYEQCAEWPTKQKNLRRANCLFVSRMMLSTAN